MWLRLLRVIDYLLLFHMPIVYIGFKIIIAATIFDTKLETFILSTRFTIVMMYRVVSSVKPYIDIQLQTKRHLRVYKYVLLYSQD